METLELVKVEQPELLQVVNESKIEFTKAESYAAGYAPFMHEVNTLSQGLKTINKINPTTTDAKTARLQRLALVKVRTAAENKKKEDKEVIVIEGRLIDGLFKVVENAAKLTESEYLEIEKHQERVEAERLSNLEFVRKTLLSPYGEVNQFVDLKAMDDDNFNKYLATEKLAFETREAQAKQAELDRIEAERLAEEERVKAELEAKAEQERIQLENEELKRTAAVKEAELKAEREIQAKAEAERLKQAKDAADKAAKIQAELKAANEKIAFALKQKEEAEQLAQEEERKRIESEEAEKKAKAKAAILAPDKVKVKALFESVKAIKVPEFKSEEAIKLGKRVEEALQIVRQLIIQDSKNLI
jgi:hypothetical protein